MDEWLKRMQAEGEQMNRALDRISGYLILAGAMLDSRSLGTLLRVMAQDDAANQEALKLRAILKHIHEQNEQRKRNETMKQLSVMILLSLMALLLIAGMPVLAQESTPDAVIVTLEATPSPIEVTAEPTPEPPPVVVVQPDPSDKTLYVIGFLAFVVLVGVQQFLQNKQLSTLAGMVNRAMENKQVIDEAHRKYMESSLSVQNTVTLIQGIAAYIGATIPGDDLAENIARFLMNVKEPPPPDTISQPDQVG